MKIVIFAALALLIGIAGGTGVSVMRAPRPAAVADSLAATADSTHADPAPAVAPPTTVAHVAPAAAAVHAAPAPEPAPSLERRERGSVAVATPHEASRDEAHAPVVSGTPEGYAQVGSIFSRMKAADVAKIVAYLDDGHVEGVVRSLGARQAATFLEMLPAERAARISRRIIVSPTPSRKS